MKIIGAEIFLESLHRNKGAKLERLGVLPFQLDDTLAYYHLQLRIEFKPPSGQIEIVCVSLNHLRRP